MFSALMRQATLIVAIVLVGGGLGAGAGAIGIGEPVALVGAILALVACLIVLWAGVNWNIEVVQAWRVSGPFLGYEILSPGFFRMVIVGFFGCGLIIGSMTSMSVLMVIAGAAGLILLVLVRERGAGS